MEQLSDTDDMFENVSWASSGRSRIWMFVESK